MHFEKKIWSEGVTSLLYYYDHDNFTKLIILISISCLRS